MNSVKSDLGVVDRKHCAITGCDDLELLDEFANFPVFMGCTNAPRSNDIHFDMRWMVSRSSGLIQLRRLLPLELLYPEAHGSGAIGAIWRRHHREFAQFIHRFTPRSVLEIGGGHGLLAKEYQANAEVPWTIVEPNPTPVDGCQANFVRGYFDGTTEFKSRFDVVAHSHVLEHIYTPRTFMSNLERVIDDKGVLCFSLPNMQKLLEQKSSNCLNFEHTLYLTEPYIEMLLELHGFAVVDKSYFLDNHSIFYAAQKSPAAGHLSLDRGLYTKNKETFGDFVVTFRGAVSDLNEKIAGVDGEIYLFGAHVFSQYLISFGLNVESMVCILDNDPNKCGKRLYGTSMVVASPEILRGKNAPIVILKAGPYNHEIRTAILASINPDVVFWE
jgi:SAM-dependent methyltransferase